MRDESGLRSDTDGAEIIGPVERTGTTALDEAHKLYARSAVNIFNLFEVYNKLETWRNVARDGYGDLRFLESGFMTAEEKAGVYSVGIPLEKSEMLRKMDNRPDETLCVSDALNILKGMDNISEQQAKYVGIDELGESDDLVVLGIKQPPLIPPEKVFEKTWRYGEGDTYQNRVKIVALVDLGGIREKVDEWNSSHRFRTLDCDILDIEKHPTVLRYVVASYVVEKKLVDQIDCYMKEPLAE